jgi:hypothetical protein
MDVIREQLKRPVVIGVAGLVVGLILGWLALGWWLFPVQWTDATPQYLRSDLKVDYLRMAADSYARNQNKTLALERYQSLGPDAEQVLTELQNDPGTLSATDLMNFTAAVGGAVAAGTSAPAGALTPQVTTTAEPAKGGGSTGVLLAALCVLTLIIAGALAYIFLIRNRGGVLGGITPAQQAQEASRQAERTDFSSTGQEAPVAQFMTTYMAGDDLYDDSFSIDSPSGDFLGECGVGISDTIGVGDPKKVTAFEVWLFDKNDIQTVTKVLMSAHAFDDQTIRQRLESKGEPVLTEPGKHVLLETATLQLEARVVDLNYGQGALPANSFFDRLTLELAVWPKVTAPAA